MMQMAEKQTIRVVIETSKDLKSCSLRILDYINFYDANGRKAN